MDNNQMKDLLKETHEKMVRMSATNGEITDFGILIIAQNVVNTIMNGARFNETQLDMLCEDIDKQLRNFMEPYIEKNNE